MEQSRRAAAPEEDIESLARALKTQDLAEPPAAWSALAADCSPLCVELDGALIKTDVLFESLARLLRQKPWLMLLVPFWLVQGRAVLQQKLAGKVTLDVASLPYNREFLRYLHTQKRAGRTIVLITAADRRHAEAVAAHLGLFDQVLAGDDRLNLKGKHKLNLLRQQIPGEFVYAGGSFTGIDIWRHSGRAIAVGTSPALLRQLRALVADVQFFDAPTSGWKPYLEALRVHQWAKNVLIFVPLIASHQLLHAGLLWKSIVCLVLFSLCSSAQYIVNDLVDIEADRRHRAKRRRPFASGAIALQTGFLLAPALLLASLATAALISPPLAGILLFYFTASLAYSLYIKRIVLLDAFCLSGLYMFRIVAGHLVTGIGFSIWLLSFAFFLFLSLAFSKRWTELDQATERNAMIAGRGYQHGDILQVNLFGVCSAFLSTVVFILYLQSDKVRVLYQTPLLLWLLAPTYLYWISRVWILSARRKIHEDPVVFVLKDRLTYVIVAIAGWIMMAASWGWLKGYLPSP